MISRHLRLAFASALFAATAVVQAAPNACPKDAFLTITGLVKPNRPTGEYVFTEAEFLRLRSTTMSTTTAWTPLSQFVGPELSTVLAAAGAPSSAKQMRFFAFDAYEITIPTSDITKYSPVMAHTQNGTRLNIASLGPVFLVYPKDRFPELTAIKSQAQFVWMVCKIDVR